MKKSAILILCLGLVASTLLEGKSPNMELSDIQNPPWNKDLCERASKLPNEQGITESAVSGLNQLGLSLYSKWSHKPGNLFLSPMSISTAFALAYAGAKGDTAKEMEKVFGFSPDRQKFDTAHLSLLASLTCRRYSTSRLSIANALWKQKGTDFLPDYAKRMKENFNGKFEDVDFKKATDAAQKINDWTSKETQGKIEKLLDAAAITPDTLLILTNAVYFKAGWETVFQKAATKPAEFFSGTGKSKKIPTMHLTTGSFATSYFEDKDLQLLEVAFKNHEQSLVVILPKKRGGLAEIEKGLSQQKLSAMLDKTKPNSVILSLPKFKLTTDYLLSDTLKSLGMVRPFQAGKADFSGIDGGKGMLYIGEGIHKAFIDLNEEGAEAAAATAVMMMAGCAPPAETKPVVFKADHPFFFAIRDRGTGSLLFLGRLSDPN